MDADTLWTGASQKPFEEKFNTNAASTHENPLLGTEFLAAG